MFIQIIKKQLDSSTLCPLCHAAMYWVDAEQFDTDLNFHQCSHCEHRVFQSSAFSCHCEACTQKRKKMLKETRLQEVRKFRKKDIEAPSLHQLSFVKKLFLLALLDDYAREDAQHDEYIYWDKIKYSPISPNIPFQQQVVKQLEKEGVLVRTDTKDEDTNIYYINVRLDGYAEPSLFSITQQLRFWFYEDLSQGVPFQDSNEVKDAIYLMLYQEIMQFTMAVCRTWHVQISGHKSFQILCYRLLDHLAVEQIFYLVHTALAYLNEQKALQPRNDGFINTHKLKKTVIQYRENALKNKWETPNFPRPEHLPFNRMGEILYFKFLNYDQRILSQPIWHLWRKISPRLSFYSDKRCMHCGSHDLEVEYDAGDYVSLRCRKCKQQDHYFTQ
ncbi:hypothetical protein P256_00335 [Acinetobacter nectaris CIP 110549]|uniref:Uncharacterized protein n=1 Tax=Acinetobacter nectaris CIP 110549 TaxID=1392540 RepID=V2TTZ8_9GAMM|nr:hypothetical protein [Acinetobacter nectaris]ESK40907.1 hypothetical protein P256_00335 [Acinetobacter nectaris CIP 110549]MCF8999103.1 hypothetical protein [Acinetobacter nectaris]MCF9026553.1 hypothetical protein [Acinetobacter nectaris]